jgi:hypothetical protein
VKHYRSSIPKAARERIVATFVDSPQKYKAAYILGGKLVGERYFHKTGELSYERPVKNGLTHGIVYRSDTPGKLLSAEPCFRGKLHGTARQWSNDGRLIGTYKMKHGTGIDLWWQESGNGVPHLSEARYLKDGMWHGFEWWWLGSKELTQEAHFWNGKEHGIERRRNLQGRLHRGYPRYWINDERVSKRQYVHACTTDPTLPPFRERDNQPKRRFPAEIRVHLS